MADADSLRELLADASRDAPFASDLGDVERRARSKGRRARVRVAVVALIVVSGAAGSLVELTGLANHARSGRVPQHPAGGSNPSKDTIPTGRMLLQLGSRAEVLPAGSTT